MTARRTRGGRDKRSGTTSTDRGEEKLREDRYTRLLLLNNTPAGTAGFVSWRKEEFFDLPEEGNGRVHCLCKGYGEEKINGLGAENVDGPG